MITLTMMRECCAGTSCGWPPWHCCASSAVWTPASSWSAASPGGQLVITTLSTFYIVYTIYTVYSISTYTVSARILTSALLETSNLPRLSEAVIACLMRIYSLPHLRDNSGRSEFMLHTFNGFT